MSPDENKGVVLRYFELSCAGDYEASFDLLSEDFELCGMGMPPMDYTVPKKTLIEMVRQVAASLTEPITFEIIGLTAEGERVAVEAERHSELADGGSYDNRYHFLFELKDGKIRRIKEYLCTFALYQHQQREKA